ncbi:hypothetical protein [Microcystis sp. LEGE 08355]|uniref:hypothetical protein n=1 Tax=Microcystis sp. LEGE 08355 TaxID=1828687 RepID=UPI00187E3251|nr:hypothetical protein [Microcystis sp. LEGE 08355]MBE9072927.1 hypothetical protein [Microcystis sp. LEGE 08355]
MTQQFYKLTLSSAIALYQNGLISATALVYLYILIKLKPEWKLTLHQRPTCSELGIQKTAFYKAISRLIALWVNFSTHSLLAVQTGERLC